VEQEHNSALGRVDNGEEIGEHEGGLGVEDEVAEEPGQAEEREDYGPEAEERLEKAVLLVGELGVARGDDVAHAVDDDDEHGEVGEEDGGDGSDEGEVEVAVGGEPAVGGRAVA